MPGSRPKIIVADCDRFIRESICLGLGSEFDAVQVSNGSEVIRVFKDSRVDAVILNNSDDAICAVEVCRALRSLKGGEIVPIYIIAEDDDGDIATDAFDSGASDFLIKPISLNLFSKRVERDLRMASRVKLSDSSVLEKAQVESELFSQFPDPAVLFGAHGIIMMVNDAFERLFGSRVSVVGHMATDLLKDFDLTQALNEEMIYTDLSCKARGVVPVRVSCVKMTKGPWRDCIVGFISAHTPAEGFPPVDGISSVRANILVLEDYDVVARSIRRLLERAGHNVCVASSSDAAYKLVSQAIGGGSSFDLAILDVSIPGSAGGGDVLKVLRGMQPKLHAIVTSGSWHDPAMNRPADFGFDAVLRKPFSRDELVDVVNKVMSKSSS